MYNSFVNEPFDIAMLNFQRVISNDLNVWDDYWTLVADFFCSQGNVWDFGTEP